MKRYLLLATIALFLVACAGPGIPPPNSIDAHYDKQGNSVQVMVSSIVPVSEVALVSPEGVRHPANGLSLVSAPHVVYNAPPSISFGVGEFGFGGGGSGFGSGIGVGVPLGRATPTEVNNQYVASALVVVPSDYAIRWSSYHLEIEIGGQVMIVAAPSPSTV